MPKMIVLVEGALIKNVQLTKSPTFFEPLSYGAMPIKTLAKKLRQPRAQARRANSLRCQQRDIQFEDGWNGQGKDAAGEPKNSSVSAHRLTKMSPAYLGALGAAFVKLGAAHMLKIVKKCH